MIPRSVSSFGSYVEVRCQFQPREVDDRWFRAEDRRYANYDPWAEFDQPSGSHLVIEIRAYSVTRYTPKGVWLSNNYETFFVAGKATRQRAVPTVALAVADLIARKKLHAYFADLRARRAEEHLEAAEQLARAINGE